MKLGELKSIPFSGSVMIVRNSDKKILTIINPPSRIDSHKYPPLPSWTSEYEVIDMRASHRYLVSGRSYPVIAITLDGNIEDFKDREKN